MPNARTDPNPLSTIGTSGTHDNTANTGSNSTITFCSDIAAFGFYGIDLGDYGGSLSLTLTDAGDVTSSLAVPETQGDNGTTNGPVIHLCFHGTGNTYKSISFDNAGTDIDDTCGFDDMTIGSRARVVVNPAPEPGTMALLSASLVGFRSLGSPSP